MSKLFVNTIAPNSGDTVTVSGSLVTTGKLTIGDASTDTVAFEAEISSSLIPDVGATYDLGTMSKAWRNLHAHGLGHIHTASIDRLQVLNVVSGSLIPDDDATYALGTMANSWGSLHVHGLGHIHTASIVKLSSSLIPHTDNSFNLGSALISWKDLHIRGAISTSLGDLDLYSSNDITLDAAGGNIEFFEGGVKQLILDMDGTVGAQIIQTKVDGDDLVFKQYDGTEVLRLSDDGSGSFTSDLTVGDDLSLISDSAVFNMGAGNDFTITHDGTTGATLEGNPININYSAGVISGSGAIAAGTVNAITSATASILKVGEVNIDTTTAASTDLATNAFFNVNGSKVTVQAITADNIADGAFTQFELRNTSIATDSVIYGAFTGFHAQSPISSSLISVATIAAKTASVFIHNETGVQINADTPFTASFVVL